jgi:hypothetical protein
VHVPIFLAQTSQSINLLYLRDEPANQLRLQTPHSNTVLIRTPAMSKISIILFSLIILSVWISSVWAVPVALNEEEEYASNVPQKFMRTTFTESVEQLTV